MYPNRLVKYIIIFFLFFNLSGCDKPIIEKPDPLIIEDDMIEMLVDIHLGEASFNNRRYRDSLVESSSSKNFYYSILNKYQVSDSTFEKSFIFYSSQPRKFEKMYQQVMNKLNIIEQEYSGRKEEPGELKLKEDKK